MLEKFLPIGSVVLLKGGKKEVMITSYCIIPNGPVVNSKDINNSNLTENMVKPVKPEEKQMFDYGGCVYPEGVLDTNLVCAFNHSQIEKVLFVGYETEKQKQLSNVLNEGLESYRKQQNLNNNSKEGTN